jgi:CRP-like cAMP-binding protein
VEFRNFFLSALPKDDLQSVLPFLSETSLERGQVLFEPGDAIEHVFFPSSAVLSVVTLMQNGDGVESSTVGYETAAPLLTALTGQTARARFFAQIGGAAVRLPASVLRSLARDSASFSELVLRHAAASSFQSEQGVACNALHPAPRRLARWILMTQDRIGTRTVPLTQDYMAIMTGVQRTTISVVASQLREAGLIRYTRGNLEVVDRPGLEGYACECYQAIRLQFDDLLDK